MRLFTLMFYLVLIILGVTFAALNASDVLINFYVTQVTLPVSVLLIIALGLGVFIGFVLFILRYWRLKSDYRRLKHQYKMKEEEIKNLRSIPLQNQH